MTYRRCICHPDDLPGVGISSGWVTANSLCHPDDILFHFMSSGWLNWGWFLIRMSYGNVIMSSGWDTLPFLSHPDEIANFDFPQHAVALQRFRSLTTTALIRRHHHHACILLQMNNLDLFFKKNWEKWVIPGFFLYRPTGGVQQSGEKSGKFQPRKSQGKLRSVKLGARENQIWRKVSEKSGNFSIGYKLWT